MPTALRLAREGTAVLAAFVMAAGEASAAVRLCEAPVSSGIVTGTSEDTAKASALAIWKSKALKHGEGYDSWRLATEKTLKCLPRGDRMFECIASAAPCIIEQAPDRRHLREKRMGI